MPENVWFGPVVKKTGYKGGKLARCARTEGARVHTIMSLGMNICEKCDVRTLYGAQNTEGKKQV